MVAKQGVDVVGEPALMPELERVPAGRQRREGASQPLLVAVEVLGELPEERTELPAARERLERLVEPLQTRFDHRQPLDVRHIAAHLY
jgi:hypothetical protein